MDTTCPQCRTAGSLIVGSYQVGNANTRLTLAFDTEGRPFDFEFDRINGEVNDVLCHCEACGAEVEIETLLTGHYPAEERKCEMNKILIAVAVVVIREVAELLFAWLREKKEDDHDQDTTRTTTNSQAEHKRE